MAFAARTWRVSQPSNTAGTDESDDAEHHAYNDEGLNMRREARNQQHESGNQQTTLEADVS